MSDLLPCPFCGGEAVFRNVEMAGCAYVTCKDCEATTADAGKDRALFNWNTRVVSASLDWLEVKLKAEREKALREAAAIAPKSIRNYGMMKPGKPDQFASREAQIVAKGFARLIEEDILALISEDATDG